MTPHGNSYPRTWKERRSNIDDSWEMRINNYGNPAEDRLVLKIFNEITTAQNAFFKLFVMILVTGRIISEFRLLVGYGQQLVL